MIEKYHKLINTLKHAAGTQFIKYDLILVMIIYFQINQNYDCMTTLLLYFYEQYNELNFLKI